MVPFFPPAVRDPDRELLVPIMGALKPVRSFLPIWNSVGVVAYRMRNNKTSCEHIAKGTIVVVKPPSKGDVGITLIETMKAAMTLGDNISTCDMFELAMGT